MPLEDCYAFTTQALDGSRRRWSGSINARHPMQPEAERRLLHRAFQRKETNVVLWTFVQGKRSFVKKERESALR